MQKTMVLAPYEVVVWGERKDKPLSRISVMAFSDDEAKSEALKQYRAANPFAKEPIQRVDVCDGVRVTPQQKQHRLFEDLAECCLGSSMDDVQGAAVNLLLTAIQRRAASLNDAEARLDELLGRGKQALKRRYCGETDARDAAAESEIGKRLLA
jgi:hypothetical protein